MDKVDKGINLRQFLLSGSQIVNNQAARLIPAVRFGTTPGIGVAGDEVPIPADGEQPVGSLPFA